MKIRLSLGSLALILLLLPIVGRLLWFYRGWYNSPNIPDIEAQKVSVPELQHKPFSDNPEPSHGKVVFDAGHNNNLDIDDLAPLRDRLTARGLTIEKYEDFGGFLSEQLRGAIAFVVVAPTSEFFDYERKAIKDFVDDGGRLIMAADPTRSMLLDDEFIFDIFDILLPESAVPAINSLANDFGVIYFDDYLYNLEENEGNYRNVRFTQFAEDYGLVENLSTLVLFAAHSLETEGVELISGDKNTYSPLRTGEPKLAAASLSEDERVLAIGDVSAFTPPFNTVEDNDRFLSNVADWIAGAERQWDVTEFPYFYSQTVDLVQLGEDEISSDFIARISSWANVFSDAELELNLRDGVESGHDALMAGTFDDLEEVQDQLDAVGVEVNVEDEIMVVDNLGEVSLEGATLFLLDESLNNNTVVVLTESSDELTSTLDNLFARDFFGCVHVDAVTICANGERFDDFGFGDDEALEFDFGASGELGFSPRIGSNAESQDAFDSGVDPLEAFALESYPDSTEPGETYSYTIEIEQSEDMLWFWGWCTSTPEILEDNMNNISFTFLMNGEVISEDDFVSSDEVLDQIACRRIFALLTDWPDGSHFLTTEVTFETTIDDGFGEYEAGTFYYDYIVSVGN